MLILSLCMSALLIAWIIACIWLTVRIFKGKKNGRALAFTFFSPIVITPLLGLIADTGSSGASEWQLVPGVIAAPALFFASPLMAYHEISKRSVNIAIRDAYLEIEANPARIWENKLYTFDSDWPPEQRAAHKYIVSVRPTPSSAAVPKPAWWSRAQEITANQSPLSG